MRSRDRYSGFEDFATPVLAVLASFISGISFCCSSAVSEQQIITAEMSIENVLIFLQKEGLFFVRLLPESLHQDRIIAPITHWFWIQKYFQIRKLAPFSEHRGAEKFGKFLGFVKSQNRIVNDHGNVVDP